MHAPVSIKGRDTATIKAGPASLHNGSGQTFAKPASERVVLIPCSASSARQWDALVRQLAGFQAVTIDLYGHGKRERWPGHGALSLAGEAAAIESACPEGEPFHLVGHSYGGAVALRFALSFPQRLRSLTLIEPSCFHLLVDDRQGHAQALDEIRAVAEAVNSTVVCGDYRGGMEVFIDYWGGAGSWAKLPDEKKAQFADLALCVAHHFWSLFEEKTALDDCRGLHVPTLILCGTKSPRPSRTIVKLLADAIPHAQHRTIRDASHMSPLTHAAQVNPLILEHLLHNAQRSVRRIGAL